MPSDSMLRLIDDVPQNIKDELLNRNEELTRLQEMQSQDSTSVPQLYGSLSKFIANPSTVSVETYKRMLDTDETLGAGIDFINLSFMARLGRYVHPSKEITQFVRRGLEKIEGGWESCLDEIFSCEWTGFSVTEKIWRFDEDFDGVPAFVPRRLVTLPPLTVVFAVDQYGNVLPDGIYQYQRYYNSYLNGYMGGPRGFVGDFGGFRPDTMTATGDLPYPIRVSGDLSYMTMKIPKDKCIHLRSTSTGKFNNPYGRSIFRRAYKNWILKEAFIKMWLVAADKKGTPLVVGYSQPNDTVLQQNQTDATGRLNEMQPKPMRADQALAAALKTMHNSSYLVLPGMKEQQYLVEAIQSQGDLNVFKEGTDYFNSALMRAMLLPPLIMSSGDGKGSYALSDTHQKQFEKVTDGKLKLIKQPILEQFIQQIIAYNFPRKLWERDGYGDFVHEEHDPESMSQLAGVYHQLTEDGYMSPESQQDMDEVRGKMGMKKAPAAEALPEPSFDENGMPTDPQGGGSLPMGQDPADGDDEDEAQGAEGEEPVPAKVKQAGQGKQPPAKNPAAPAKKPAAKKPVAKKSGKSKLPGAYNI